MSHDDPWLGRMVLDKATTHLINMDDADRRQLLDKVGHMLLGTADQVDHALDKLDLEHLDADEVEDGLLDLPTGIERCSGCHWWHEVPMLDDEGRCDDCAPDEDTEDE